MGASGNIGYATFITPIIEEDMIKLEDYLRTHVEPHFDEHSIVKCQETFRFDEIRNLHFCSFIILDRDGEEFPPCLVFEATFEGSRDSFLDTLLRHASKAIHEIYSHCKGYPKSGLDAPKLVQDYLASKLIAEETSFMGDAGIEVLTTLSGRFEGREHFGFKDGISQPTIEGTEQALGLSKKQRRISVVKPGEFVLGYENERGAKVTFSYSTARGTRDLARNGTYLVFRQLKQHVDVFDRFLSETAALLHGGPEEKAQKERKESKQRTEGMERVAAPLVGRNVNGEPLIPRGENSPSLMI